MNGASGSPWRRILLGSAVSLAAVAVLFWVVDWRGMAGAWSRAQAWVILPAVALALVSMFLRAMAWRALMRNAPSIRRSFWMLQIGYLMNSVLPFRVGDVARAVLISRPARGHPPEISTGEALSSVALERTMDVLFLGVLILLSLLTVAGQGWSAGALAAYGLLAVAGLAALIVLGWQRVWIMGVLGRGFGRFAFWPPLARLMETFLTGLDQARDLRRMAPVLFWFLLCWLAWWLEYWVVLAGFLPGAPAGLALAAMVGAMLGVMVPSSPGNLGVYEAAVTMTLVLAGMDRETAAAYALSIHILNILTLSALGVIGLLVEGQSFGSVLQSARRTEPA